MKTQYLLLTIIGLGMLAGPCLRAQSTNTNTLPLMQTVKYQVAVEHDRALGQRAVLPPGLKEKMRLTSAQRIELKPIEDDFANTSQKYQLENQARIDAANDSNRRARASKDAGMIQAARTQMQGIWAGLQPFRVTAVGKIKPLLTPDQLVILEDEKNQWKENHLNEANDPSAN